MLKIKFKFIFETHVILIISHIPVDRLIPLLIFLASENLPMSEDPISLVIFILLEET